MIGIALVKNSAKPTIFGTGDSNEPLKSSSFNCLCSPLLKCSSFKAKKFHQKRNTVYIMINIIFKIRKRVIGRKRIKRPNLSNKQNIENYRWNFKENHLKDVKALHLKIQIQCSKDWLPSPQQEQSPETLPILIAIVVLYL